MELGAGLFEEQSASEKRRLLEFVLSNSIWARGELTPVFRQPFDMLADIATVGAQKWLLESTPAAIINKSYPPRTRTWTDGTKIRSAAITPGGKVRTFSRECRNHKSIGHYVLRFITLEDLP